MTDTRSTPPSDALGEVCPTCKAIPGIACRDKQTRRTIGDPHPARVRKADRRKRGLEVPDQVRRGVAGIKRAKELGE